MNSSKADKEYYFYELARKNRLTYKDEKLCLDGDLFNGIILNYNNNINNLFFQSNKTPFKNGLIDGVCKFYPRGTLDEESIEKEAEYKKGKLNGRSILYFPNSNRAIAQITTYKMGVFHGSQKKFYRNGNVEEECSYENGKKSGIKKRYYEDGKNRESETYKNGLKHVNTYFHDNGNVASIAKYKNDLLHGVLSHFHYDGQLSYSIAFKNGEYDHPDGDFKFFYDDGSLHMSGRMKNGKLDGLCRTYCDKNRNGFLSSEINYKNGVKNGLCKYFYMHNGKLRDEGFYKEGKRDGIHKDYYDNGQLRHSNAYKDGKSLQSYKYYRKNGQLEVSFDINTGRERYYSNGQLQSRIYLINGYPYYEEYNEDGSLICKEDWWENHDWDWYN